LAQREENRKIKEGDPSRVRSLLGILIVGSNLGILGSLILGLLLLLFRSSLLRLLRFSGSVS